MRKIIPGDAGVRRRLIEGPGYELDGHVADDQRHRPFSEQFRISGSLLDAVRCWTRLLQPLA